MSVLSQRPSAPPRIVTPVKGNMLTWDADDRLWLLRAVEVEGAPRDLVAQVLVNRWAWLFDTVPGKYTKLAELVRAYAQPVNPAWFPNGKLFLQQLERTPQAEHAPLIAQARKREETHATRTSFSPATVTAVDQALYGPLTIPPGALHFAAPSLVRNDLPVLVESSNGSNVIYGESQGRGSRARYGLTSGAPSRGRAVIAIVALFSFGLGAALWKGRAK